MNFFEQQDRSRRATRTLVGMFGAAVLFTGICIYLAAMLTINTTSWKWAVFGGRLTCQPIVSTSLTVSPRALSSETTIPLLPSAPNSLAEHLSRHKCRLKDERNCSRTVTSDYARESALTVKTEASLVRSSLNQSMVLRSVVMRLAKE
jgi:nitrogen fixation/metabolism regulation signal transduction histidine kinase